MTQAAIAISNATLAGADLEKLIPIGRQEIMQRRQMDGFGKTRRRRIHGARGTQEY